jgi:hypothetical protein
MHIISCMAAATHVRISAASFYSILTISLGKCKVCEKWIPHMLKDGQRAMHVLLASTHLRRRNEGNSSPRSHFNGWQVMDALMSAETTEC